MKTLKTTLDFSKLMSLIIFALVGLSCAGSQHTVGLNDAAVPINTNEIIVQTNLDAESAYKKVAKALQDFGYTFRSTDETLKNISTEFKGVSQRWGVDNTFVRIAAYVKGEKNAEIVIRGWYKTLENENTETGQTVKKFGQNGSPTRNAWIEMFKVAESLGGTLSYK